MPVLFPKASSSSAKDTIDGDRKAKPAANGKDTASASSKSKGKASVNASVSVNGSGMGKTGGKAKGGAAAYEVQIETYSYPAWESLKVQKVL